ncbi:RNase A-like domain-containing protein [Kineococcus sp. SYSU DK003]|uniref:RNase A-like domain-containing protein n=1 Tax=Kineococcus sp. SYSU DK003 TaxID=3383124 RepID=UPI003D7EF621
MDELSPLSAAAAAAAGATARAAATGIAEVGTRVEAAVQSLGGWYGAAQAGFAERVVELQTHLDTLAHTATAGATLIEEYALALGTFTARLASVDAEIAVVQARVDAGVGDLASFQQDWAQLERWQASRAVVLEEFDETCATFATRLHSVVEQVPDRPRRLGEHVDDAARVVADSTSGAAFTALGWAWDAPGWTATWQQVPGAAWEAATHPVDTLADAVAWDDWADGRYGAAAATLGTAAVGRGLAGRTPLGKTLPEGHRLREYLGQDGNPLPQSVDELFAGVDLGHSEVFASAHTLARHVEVDDEFLWRRLETGQVEGGVSGKPPVHASRWADQETAEEAITRALRDHEADVTRAIDSGEKRYVLRAPSTDDVGVIWTLGGDGRPLEVPATEIVVVLRKAGDGSWYIETAYPDA